jgi:hypothetical protein
MLSTSGELKRVRKNSSENRQPGKEKSQLPWIQKYLEMADLLIRRGKHKGHDEDHASESPQMSNAIPPQKRD